MYAYRFVSPVIVSYFGVICECFPLQNVLFVRFVQFGDRLLMIIVIHCAIELVEAG